MADESGALGASGRGLGALFHAVMAAVDVRQRPGPDAASGLRALAESQAALLGLGASDAEEVAGLCARALANAEFRALLDGATEVSREVSFSVPLSALPVAPPNAGGFVEGSVDLLVTGPAGTVVLDYKTDAVRSGGVEELAGRYWPQLALYGLAARACGRAAEPMELALFFIRPSRILRHPLDAPLLAELLPRLHSLLSGRPSSP